MFDNRPALPPGGTRSCSIRAFQSMHHHSGRYLGSARISAEHCGTLTVAIASAQADCSGATPLGPAMQQRFPSSHEVWTSDRAPT
jgi:hypothetical protein